MPVVTKKKTETNAKTNTNPSYGWHVEARKKHPFASLHNHTHFSNQRFRDSKITVPSLLINEKKKGAAGVAITEHGTVSSAVKLSKFADSHPDFFNGKDGKGTFKAVIGEEIYLDDASIIEDAVKNNDKTKFFHLVITAQDDIGMHALRIITSNSWGLPMEHVWNDTYDTDMRTGKKIVRPHAFFFRGLRRIPTYKDWLQKLMFDPHFKFRGHLFVGTACLGSELSRCILTKDKSGAKRFIKYLEKTFGKDHVYFEMMPADNRHGQITVNHALWNISHGNGYFDDDTGKGIPCVITTDAHYIDDRDRHAHSTFLKAENPNRDVVDFYKYAHTYTYDELARFFPKDVLEEATANSMKILHQYAPIWHATNEPQMRKLAKENPQHPPVRLHYLQEIPKSPAPKHIPRVNLQAYAKKYKINWSNYPFFKMFDYPEKYRNPKTGKGLSKRTCRADRIYLYKIFKGMDEKQLPYDKVYLGELNWEFQTLHYATLHFHQPMSAYFLTVFYAVIDTCWKAGSLVGPGRGSCSEYLSNYILNISQVNSIKWHLWGPRFLCVSRVKDNSQPDIDLDSESSKRPNIMALSRKKFGRDRVMNFSVFDKQASKSTIYDACRGWKIPYIQSQNIANQLPADARGMGNISLHDAFYGNKKADIQPAKGFIKAVAPYKGLKNDMLSIVNTINGVGCHASGVAFFNEPLTQRNAMMLTNKQPGIPITQFSAHDSAYLSSMKYDMLTLSALDRIHEAFNLLIAAGRIQKVYVPDYKNVNGKKTYVGKHYSLYKTYMKYFGPQALDYTSKGMFDMLFKGYVTNAFEFSSLVGRAALLQMHATDFSALVAANALMRLTVDPNSDTYESKMMKKYWGQEQPIQRYVRYRDNPGDWDKDMKKAKLNQHEIDIMHQFLGRHRGVCYSQEDLMKLDMRICYGVKDYAKMSPNDKLSYIAYTSANTLRKAVAKKNPKILEQARQSFYKMGKKRGVRREFLDYVWYNCAVPAKNYSFNLSHGVAYTIILIIEMNICYRFGPIYWQTACLSVNAGMYGSQFKNPNYNKLCHALANKHIADKVVNPNINKSQKGFVPYHNHILYGLYPISGLSADDCETILKQRKEHGAFKSFTDFLKRTKFTKKTNISLIKSGAFDCFGVNRYQLMEQYINIVVPPKKRLTTVQIRKMQKITDKQHQIPKVWKDAKGKAHPLDKMVRAYNFRDQTLSRGKRNMLTVSKQRNDIYKKYYIQHYLPHLQAMAKTQTKSLMPTSNDKNKGYTIDAKGMFHPDKKLFNKWYNQFIKPLKAWLKTPQALKDEQYLRARKLYDKYCQGNISSWEMDSLGCYIHTHELELTDIKQHFPIVSYDKLNSKPKPIYKGSFKDRRTHQTIHYSVYHNHWIYGTVIGKTANKGLVYLLTPQGIANVRVGKWRYKVYNKKITKKVNGKRKMIKDSWFNRGTKLLIIGHKLGDNFFANKTKSYLLFKRDPNKDNSKSNLKKYKVGECLYRVIGYASKNNNKVILHDKNGQKPTFTNYDYRTRQSDSTDEMPTLPKPPKNKHLAGLCFELNKRFNDEIRDAERTARIAMSKKH